MRRSGKRLGGLAVIAASLLLAEADTFPQRKARIRELLAAKNFPAALTGAQALNKEWPDDIETYQLLATALMATGDCKQAEKQLQWMLDLRLGKSDWQGWMLVARFRDATKDIEGALEAVNLAHGRAADSIQRTAALIYAGALHAKAGRPEVAAQADAALKEIKDQQAARALLQTRAPAARCR